jgi:ubiquinone/menaquinone biosynthesis C-methylase UbiE
MPAQREEIRHFYDEVYYKNSRDVVAVSRHLRRLALRFEPWKNLRILDVACGTGRWLMAVHALGAIPSGIDLSRVALDACQRTLPKVELHCGSAETLPFDNCQFDFIS